MTQSYDDRQLDKQLVLCARCGFAYYMIGPICGRCGTGWRDVQTPPKDVRDVRGTVMDSD